MSPTPFFLLTFHTNDLFIPHVYLSFESVLSSIMKLIFGVSFPVCHISVSLVREYGD